MRRYYQIEFLTEFRETFQNRQGNVDFVMAGLTKGRPHWQVGGWPIGRPKTRFDTIQEAREAVAGHKKEAHRRGFGGVGPWRIVEVTPFERRVVWDDYVIPR